MTVKVTVDNMPNLLGAVDKLVERDLLVGVPSENAQSIDGHTNKAALAYIHDNGAPEANIPARPFMRPGIEKARTQIEAALVAGARKALAGDAAAVNAAFVKAGQRAVDSIKQIFRTSEGFAPLANSTLRARARMNRGRQGAQREIAARAAGEAPSNGNVRPLVITGELRDSITFVVRDKGSSE